MKSSAAGSSGSGGGTVRRGSPGILGYCVCFCFGLLVSRQLSTVGFCLSTPPTLRNAVAFLGGTATPSTLQPSSASNERARNQSLGFLDDISDEEWNMMWQRVKNVHPNTNGDPYKRFAFSNAFFQNHYEPNFNCRHERRIGRLGDGGKWVCDPHRLKGVDSSKGDNNSNKTNKPCLVYSIGSNGDPSFEEGIQRDIGHHCEIHIFDMDNYTEKVEKAVPGAHYHQWGIAKETNTVPNRRRRIYKTLEQTMQELGHLGRTIDIFKIDCEGCEWDIYPHFFLPGIDLRQILIELHGSNDRTKFSGVRDMSGLKAQYRQVRLPETPDFFRAMEQHYVIFHKEPNIQWSVGASAIEYSFLKLHPDFFRGIVSENPMALLAS